ncbi:UNVERIFIED_CONTAM: hypothetical protein O8I53_13100 [Campylobacter lari]
MKNKFFEFIKQESLKPYFKDLNNKINKEAKTNIIYPKKENIFECLKYFEPEETKLIILGQDPYFLKNQADGLAFSTNLDKCPRSLSNIIKEIKKDYPEAIVETYSLKH